MIQLKEIGVRKWVADFGGNPPTIDRDTNGANKGARVGDIAIDISVTPNKQWVCIDNTPGTPVWIIRFSNSIEFAPGDVLVQGDLILADGFGIKSQLYQTKILPEGVEFWTVQSDLGLKFTNLSGTETRGYIHTSGTEIGFLDSYGNWAVRVEEGAGVDFRYNGIVKAKTVNSGLNVNGCIGINEDYPQKDIQITNTFEPTILIKDASKATNHRLWSISNVNESLNFGAPNDDLLTHNFILSISRDGYVNPGLNNTYSLGSSLYRWNNFYINNIRFNDSSKILNEDNDHEIFSDGSYYWCLKSQGGLRFYDTSNNQEFNIVHTASNEFGFTDENDKWYIRSEKNGAVYLYYNGVQKFQTTDTGISINGNFNFTGWLELTGDVGVYNNTYETRFYNKDDADYWYLTSNKGLKLQDTLFNDQGSIEYTSGHSIIIRDRHNNIGLEVQDLNSVRLYYDGTLKAYTFSGGFCSYTSLAIKPYTGSSSYSLYDTNSYQVLVNALDVGQYKTEFVSFNSDSNLGGFTWYKATATSVYDKIMELDKIGKLWIKEDLTFNIAKNCTIGNYTSDPDYLTLRSNNGLRFQNSLGTQDQFYISTNSDQDLYILDSSKNDIARFANNGVFYSSNEMYTFGGLYKVWHEGNDGHTSGLDADTVDGYHGQEIASGIAQNQPANEDLAVGWYTIAVCNGSVASAKFSIKNNDQNHYQSLTFYASVEKNNNGTINILSNSTFDNNQCNIKNIRIRTGGQNDGALLQVYIDNNDNRLTSYIFDNFESNGWILKNWVADGVNPGDVPNYSGITNTNTEVDISKYISNNGAYFERIHSKRLYIGSDIFSDNATINVISNNNHLASINAYGASQGTGLLYVGQDENYGGGIVYNGDDNYLNWAPSDNIVFYRRSGGNNTPVFRYSYGNNNVYFHGSIYPNTNNSYNLGSSSFEWGSIHTSGIKHNNQWRFWSDSQNTYIYAKDTWLMRLRKDGSAYEGIWCRRSLIPDGSFNLGLSGYPWNNTYSNHIYMYTLHNIYGHNQYITFPNNSNSIMYFKSNFYRYDNTDNDVQYETNLTLNLVEQIAKCDSFDSNIVFKWDRAKHNGSNLHTLMTLKTDGTLYANTFQGNIHTSYIVSTYDSDERIILNNNGIHFYDTNSTLNLRIKLGAIETFNSRLVLNNQNDSSHSACTIVNTDYANTYVTQFWQHDDSTGSYTDSFQWIKTKRDGTNSQILMVLYRTGDLWVRNNLECINVKSDKLLNKYGVNQYIWLPDDSNSVMYFKSNYYRYDNTNNDVRYEVVLPGIVQYIISCDSPVNNIAFRWSFCNYDGSNINHIMYLYRPGNLWIAGTLTENSSLLVKTDIDYNFIDTSKLYELKPVTYYFKDEDKNVDVKNKNVKHIGLIAEELEEYYPELVKGEGEQKGIDYSRLTVLLLKEIQNLNERIKKLEASAT